VLRSLTAALVSTAVCALLVSVASAQPIGSATEARNKVSGQRNATVRQITVGSRVSANETVKTGEASSGAFRFVDGSNLNVGERSSVVLDKFVFDPNGPNEVILNVTKGAMRFVSGSIGTRKTVVTYGAVMGIRN